MGGHLSARTSRASRRRSRSLSFFDLRWVENNGVSLGLLSADSELGPLAAGGDDRGDRRSSSRSGCGARSRRDDSVALALVLGGALGNILDRVRLGYVVDFADLHFGDVAALFGLQCRRRRDYHRRAAFACPRAPDARWQGAEEGSLTMRIAPLVLAGSAAAPARRLRRRRPVRPRAPRRVRGRAQRAAGRPARFRADPAAAGRGRSERHRSARPGAAGPVRRPAAAQRGREQPAPGRPCRARRAGRPLGRRRSADRRRQPRHARPDHPPAAPGRRPGSLGQRSQLTPRRHPGEGRDLVEISRDFSS